MSSLTHSWLLTRSNPMAKLLSFSYWEAEIELLRLQKLSQFTGSTTLVSIFFFFLSLGKEHWNKYTATQMFWAVEAERSEEGENWWETVARETRLAREAGWTRRSPLKPGSGIPSSRKSSLTAFSQAELGFLQDEKKKKGILQGVPQTFHASMIAFAYRAL